MQTVYFKCFAVFWFCLVGKVACLVSWSLLEWCGSEIAVTDRAGQLEFNTLESRPSTVPEYCHVTIKPATFGDSDKPYMILFYFTLFDLPGECKDARVVIQNRKGNTILGLPKQLCGKNSTLTDPHRTFTSAGQPPSIAVTLLTRNQVTLFEASFQMKFITYRNDTCNGANEHSCSNGRCIPTEFKCLEDLDACGEADDNCASAEETTGFFTMLGNILKHIFIIVLIIATIVIIKKLVSKFGKKCCDCFRDTADLCCHTVGQGCHSCSSICGQLRIRLSHVPTLRPCKSIRSRLCPNNNEETTGESVNNDGSERETNLEVEGVTNSAFSSAEERDIQLVLQMEFDSNANDVTTPRQHLYDTGADYTVEPPRYEDLVSSECLNTRVEIQNDEQDSSVSNRPYMEQISPNVRDLPLAVGLSAQHDMDTESEPPNRITLRDNAQLPEEVSSTSGGSDVSILDRYIAECSDFYSSDSDWEPEPETPTENLETVINRSRLSSGHFHPDMEENTSESNSQMDSADSLSDLNSQSHGDVRQCSAVDNDSFVDESDSDSQVDDPGSVHEISTVETEDPIPELPPCYDEAVPPPYYYDYIANVDRYRP